MQAPAPESTCFRWICAQILENPQKWGTHVQHLHALLPGLSREFLQRNKTAILGVAYLTFKNLSENGTGYVEKDKILLVAVFRGVFEKVAIDKAGVFFNLSGFLLSEIYHPMTHKVLPVSEEYKLSVIECVIALTKSLSWDVTVDIYKKENTPKLCQMLYVALEIAKHEKFRTLRLAAIELLMCLAQISDENETNDLEVRCSVANVLMFFLPGLASGLRNIALEDEKSGHKTIEMALRAWGRIVALLMEDYNASDQKINTLIFSEFNSKLETKDTNEKVDWKNVQETKKYIENLSKTPEWYRKTDENLLGVIKTFSKLIEHSHVKVRLELVKMCCLLLEKCSNTMPKCISHTVHILIGCSEDSDEEVKTLAQKTLHELSESFSSDLQAQLLENLEEKFYGVVSTLPRIFNRQEKKEQLLELKLLCGYINLFGKYKLASFLLSITHLQHLLKTLLHICEFETGNVHLLEEIANPDLEIDSTRPQWKEFHYFPNDPDVTQKLQQICQTFCKFHVTDIVSDFLLDVFRNDPEHKSEATFLLNSLFAEKVEIGEKEKNVIREIIETYLEPEHWNLNVAHGNDFSLTETRKSILQICLQTEGIGIFAVVLQQEFDDFFLLKSLYRILERAGSSHPLIRQAGSATLKNVISACGYKNVTEFVNLNSDYFTYHVTQKLNRMDFTRDVLNVLAVVMDFSTVEVLQSLSNIIEVVLAQSCDKFQHKFMHSYLRVFNIFIKCLCRWFCVERKMEPIKSKLQKQKEFEEFRISGVKEVNDFSDDIMGKSAEEMYKEDLEKSKEELLDTNEDDEVEPYKKPVAPTHINMAVATLKRTLHFLPSKDRQCKLLALEVLRNGLEVIRDWEDELLPIIHQIWSPLVDRFFEREQPLIVNLSFELLVVMGRLSKDFIRARTAKDVLPQILTIMKDLSKQSHLKDKGSSYRYTQAYKLQLNVLQHFAPLIINLELSDSQIELAMNTVHLYLNNKQPLPLQEAALSFFQTLAMYDADLVKKHLLQRENTKTNADDCKTNISLLLEKIENETSPTK